MTKKQWMSCLCFLAFGHVTSPLASELDGFSDLSGGLDAPAIHATRLDYSRFDLPVAVTVITQEDIRRLGFLEVSELFRAVPGFRIVKTGDESRLSYHGTTARQNRRMKVTLNGKNILVGDGAYVEFDRLPIDLDDIVRVTITRGPNGATFGDNAFMASIDFTTINQEAPEGISVRAGGGDQGREKFSIALNRTIGDARVTFSGAHEKDDGYDFSDSFDNPRNDGKEIDRGYLSIETNPENPSIWRFETSAYDSEHAIGVRLLSLSGEQTNEGFFASIQNKREINQSSRLDWHVSYNEQEEKIRFQGCYTPESIAGLVAAVSDPIDLQGLLAPTLFVPTLLGVPLADTCFFNDLNTESERIDAEVEYETRFDQSRVVVGASATDIQAESRQRFNGRDQDQTSVRVFAEGDYAFGDFHSSVGVMAQDSDNVDDTEFAGRFGLNWQFANQQSIRYAVARAFRIPSLVETDAEFFGEFFFGRRSDDQSAYTLSLPLPLVPGPDNLEPETIVSHEIGYFGTFANSRAAIDVRLFHEDITDPVQESPFDDVNPLLFNGESFKLRGGELETSFRVTDRWSITGQYSYIDSDADMAFEQSLHGDHAGSVSLSYRPSEHHTITSSYYGNSTISGNSYDRFDLVYGYNRDLNQSRLRLQIILQHHKGGVDGIRGPNPFLTDEGHFDELTQIYGFVELTF